MTDRQQLIARITHGAERAQALAEVLGQEERALHGESSEALGESAANKQALIDELEGLGSELDGHFQAAGPTGSVDVRAWLESLGTDVAAASRRLLDALEACQQANARNGAAIRLLAHHNRHLVNLLQGQPATASLYDQDGRARHGARTRYAAQA